MADTTHREDEQGFRLETWLAEGLAGLARLAGERPLPPEFWQHLGQAMCELGEALHILSTHLRAETGSSDLLDTYERLMDAGIRLGQPGSTGHRTDEPGGHHER